MFWSHTEALTMLNEHGIHPFTSMVATHLAAGDDGEIHLVFHGTRVVTYHPDNTFSLMSGGQKTKTTKARLCEFGPGDVVQRAGEWFVVSEDGESVGFFEGIRVDSSGEVVDPDDYDELNPSWDPREETLDNQIGKMYF
jgi:hypothetical protein